MSESMRRSGSLSTRSGERGSSKMNLFVTLLILGVMAFAGIKIVPIYFANYQLQDSVESESRFALTGYPKRSVDDIRNDVSRKAQELGIPAKPEDVHVEVSNGSVDIGLDYTVLIDLAVFQWNKQFHVHADNHTI